MIEELRIRNFKIFDDVIIEFGNHFNVITGETGAGKSMLIDSLDFLLGKRVSTSVIKEGRKNCIVEASFLMRAEEVKKLISDIGIEPEDGRVIMRRIMDSAGRSRAYLMDTMVSIGTLREIGEHLVEITTQGGTIKLLNPSTHTLYLDAFIGSISVGKELKSLFKEIRTLENEIKEEEERIRERERKRDIIQFELKEIEGADLKPGEYEVLMEKRELLRDAEKIREKLFYTLNLLYEGEGSAYEKIGESTKVILSLSDKLKAVERVSQHLQSAKEYLSDAVDEINNTLSEISTNPEELERVEERITLIKKLMRKYGPEIEEILKYRDKIKEELSSMEGAEERLEYLRKQLTTLKEELYTKALNLSVKRRKTNLAKMVEKALKELGIKDAKFEVELRTVKDGIKVRDKIIGETGLEKCTFLFSSSKTYSPKPLHQVASGGELSRALLAIKSTISLKEDVSTLIYDEIDAGVGGNTGFVLGKKLLESSRHVQVICITHLPQIAVYGNRHLVVKKSENNIEVKAVDGEERVEEIIRMLGGKEQESARKLAKEMLKSAGAL